MKYIVRQAKLLLIAALSITAILLVTSRNTTPLSPTSFQIKRLQEKFFMKLKQSPQEKLEYYTFLLNERLNDLSVVAKDDDSSYILTTSLRYSTTAGQMTNLIKDNGLKNQIPNVLTLFQNHRESISTLVELYPKDFSEDWKFLQDDINYLNIYSSILSQLK